MKYAYLGKKSDSVRVFVATVPVAEVGESILVYDDDEQTTLMYSDHDLSVTRTVISLSIVPQSG